MNREEYEKTFRAEKRYWWFVAKRELIARWAERGLRRRQAPRILDLGCGAGANLEALSTRGEAFGLDFSPAALECASRRALTALAAGRADRLPFPAGAFDLVTALDLLEHLPEDEPVLAEARRVLKPGGWFLATVPAYPWLWSRHDLAMGHERRYSRSAWQNQLQRAGFQLQRLVYYYGLVFPLILPARIGQKWWGSREETVSYEPWPVLNPVLLAVARAEIRLLDFGALPFGTTLVALAQKPAA